MTIIGSARLSANDPKQAAAEGAEAGKVQSHTGDPAPPLQPPADVVQWNDPGFDHYVDLSLLQRPLTESDAEMLTDAALQFAEGERVLLRSHKMIKAGENCSLAPPTWLCRQATNRRWTGWNRQPSGMTTKSFCLG